MHVIAPPTQVGADNWPVLSFVRLSTAAHPAEFVVIVDCGEGTPEHRYATLRVCVWPQQCKVSDGEYNLTFDQARRSLAERAGLARGRTTTVEVVVVRDPDAANDYAVFVDGARRTDATTGTLRVIAHDIDLGAVEITAEWVAEQLRRADALSPAAARHARDAVHSYVDDIDAIADAIVDAVDRDGASTDENTGRDGLPGGTGGQDAPCGGGAA